MYSIIIPAYNEERRIKNTLLNYYEYFKSKNGLFEIIIVSDGKDNTGNIVKDCAKYKDNILLLSFPNRLGKGGALLEGFKVAKGDIIGFTDADGSVKPKDFYRLLKKIKPADCCIASRRIRGARILYSSPFKRRFMSLLFIVFVNSLFFLGIKDTQCGAKTFNKELVKAISKDVKTRGFEFDAELLWRIKKRGYKIEQMPVDWHHAEHSSVRLNNILKMFLNLLSVRLGARRELN